VSQKTIPGTDAASHEQKRLPKVRLRHGRKGTSKRHVEEKSSLYNRSRHWGTRSDAGHGEAKEMLSAREPVSGGKTNSSRRSHRSGREEPHLLRGATPAWGDCVVKVGFGVQKARKATSGRVEHFRGLTRNEPPMKKRNQVGNNFRHLEQPTSSKAQATRKKLPLFTSPNGRDQ